MPAQRWVHIGLILSVVTLSVCVTVLVMGSSRATVTNTGLTGSKAYDFHLRDDSGNAVALSDYRGKIAVLLFASQSSQTMEIVAPDVHRLMGTFQDEADVKLLGVSFAGDIGLLGPRATGKSALETTCPGLRVAFDLDGSTTRAFRATGTPTIIVVDREGLIRGRITLDRESAFVAVNNTIHSLRGRGLSAAVAPPPPVVEAGEFDTHEIDP